MACAAIQMSFVGIGRPFGCHGRGNEVHPRIAQEEMEFVDVVVVSRAVAEAVEQFPHDNNGHKDFTRGPDQFCDMRLAPLPLRIRIRVQQDFHFHMASSIPEKS